MEIGFRDRKTWMFDNNMMIPLKLKLLTSAEWNIFIIFIKLKAPVELGQMDIKAPKESELLSLFMLLMT